MLKLILLLTFAVSCGSDEKEIQYVPVPSPDNGSNNGNGTNGGGSNGGSSGGTKASYSQVQALLLTYCQACHANSSFLSSERGLIASSSLNRIRSRSMPPANANRKLGDKERSTILSFF